MRALLILLIFLAFPPPLFAQDSLENDLGHRVEAFSLTDQNGRTVTLDDLRGKVWVAQFFFTCCSQGCPQTTAGMKQLQDAFRGNPNVALLSFTLDPGTDNSRTLQKYARDHGADPDQWLFLTGDEKVIHRLARESFYQSVVAEPGAEPGKKISHGLSLLVVDQDGWIRGYVDGKDSAEVKRLEDRIRLLVGRRHFLPALNASLNSLAAVLLIAGYLAIRRRRETLHKTCMLSALGVSACFLASYLYYHFGILKGHSTPFQGSSELRPIYLGILLSHTVLAVIVAPLALVTAFLGWTDRRSRHVRLAKITLPLWLYVSLTGVAVYWLLYHL